jgi:hypothetical protein
VQSEGSHDQREAKQHRADPEQHRDHEHGDCRPPQGQHPYDHTASPLTRAIGRSTPPAGIASASSPIPRRSGRPDPDRDREPPDRQPTPGSRRPPCRGRSRPPWSAPARPRPARPRPEGFGGQPHPRHDCRHPSSDTSQHGNRRAHRAQLRRHQLHPYLGGTAAWHHCANAPAAGQITASRVWSVHPGVISWRPCHDVGGPCGSSLVPRNLAPRDLAPRDLAAASATPVGTGGPPATLGGVELSRAPVGLLRGHRGGLAKPTRGPSAVTVSCAVERADRDCLRSFF